MVQQKRPMRAAKAVRKTWYSVVHPVNAGTGIYTRDTIFSGRPISNQQMNVLRQICLRGGINQ